MVGEANDGYHRDNLDQMRLMGFVGWQHYLLVRDPSKPCRTLGEWLDQFGLLEEQARPVVATNQQMRIKAEAAERRAREAFGGKAP